MRINNINWDKASFTGVLNNRVVLKTLEKVSEHGTSFAAGTSLAMSLTVRPLSIWATPDTEKENKQYAISNSIGSGIVKFAMVEAIALPVENAVKNIDNNPAKFLRKQTITNLKGKAPLLIESNRYKLSTQIIKLGTGFLTAIPKSVLTIAFIPVIMDKVFNIRKHQPKNYKQKDNNITFSGSFSDKISRQIAKLLNNRHLQCFAGKNENNAQDIAKHMSAATDILLTASSALMTIKSDEIKENRKKALIYNNIISTGITLGLGYGIDNVIKDKTNSFINKFSRINKTDPKLHKYIEGINILRPAIIFAGIYYGILPIFSTYIAEKVDKYLVSKEGKTKHH